MLSCAAGRIPAHLKARWQSGYAAACKAADIGSIPFLASISLFISARVAELVDATDLKSVVREDVRVRVSLRAPIYSKAYDLFLKEILVS